LVTLGWVAARVIEDLSAADGVLNGGCRDEDDREQTEGANRDVTRIGWAARFGGPARLVVWLDGRVTVPRPPAGLLRNPSRSIRLKSALRLMCRIVRLVKSSYHGW
jgi:hypothetical protein